MKNNNICAWLVPKRNSFRFHRYYILSFSSWFCIIFFYVLLSFLFYLWIVFCFSIWVREYSDIFDIWLMLDSNGLYNMSRILYTFLYHFPVIGMRDSFYSHEQPIYEFELVQLFFFFFFIFLFFFYLLVFFSALYIFICKPTKRELLTDAVHINPHLPLNPKIVPHPK